jgi:hypothetical protein
VRTLHGFLTAIQISTLLKQYWLWCPAISLSPSPHHASLVCCTSTSLTYLFPAHGVSPQHLNRHFPKEDRQHIKRCWISLTIKKIAITMRYHFTSTRMARTATTKNKIYAEDVEKSEL